MTTMTAPGWQVTAAVVDGRPVLIVEQVTAAGRFLPDGRGSGRCSTPEQVRDIIGAEAFARLA